MASTPDFIAFVTDQLSEAGSVTFRKMFGEYAVYCDGKVVALVCDDRLFVKPTEGGRAWVGEVEEAPPYPGAKNYWLVEELLDDRERLSTLIRVTAGELPEPKPKKNKAAAPRSSRKSG